MSVTTAVNQYLGAQAQKSSLNLLHGQTMPYIRGTWFFVDPYAGSNSNDGLSVESAVADIVTAYALCTDLVGDGICILSAGSTSAQTTSYLKQPIAWSLNGVTVYGVDSEVGYSNRARIASKDYTTTSSTISQQAHSITRTTGSFTTDGWVAGMTGYTADSGSNNGATFTVTVATALVLTISETFNVQTAGSVGSCTMTSYCAQLVTVSGANNRFINLQFWNAGTQVGALGGIIVTGDRNKFINCHIAGGTGCTATANERSVELGSSGVENVFADCVIGEDTTNRGNNANCELYLNGTSADGRNYFTRCHFLAYTDGGTAHGAIKSAGAASQGRNLLCIDCLFEVYRPNLGADQASLFIGTALTSAKIILAGSSTICGYAALDSVITNHCVFASMAVPTAKTSLSGVAVTYQS
jgi:hypothetical protein